VFGVLGVCADMAEDVDSGHGGDLGRKKKSRPFSSDLGDAETWSDATGEKSKGRGPHQEATEHVGGTGSGRRRPETSSFCRRRRRTQGRWRRLGRPLLDYLNEDTEDVEAVLVVLSAHQGVAGVGGSTARGWRWFSVSETGLADGGL
jgi:hypothetical protein